MNRTAATLCLVALAALFPAACAATSPSGPPGAEQGGATVKLYVDGMTCPSRCPREVREMLSTVDGFMSADVDVTAQTVTCRVVAGTDPGALVHAIHAPYHARLLY